MRGPLKESTDEKPTNVELNKRISLESNIGLMLSQISHDIRSPLTGVLSILRSCDGTLEANRESVIDAAEKIHMISRRMSIFDQYGDFLKLNELGLGVSDEEGGPMRAARRARSGRVGPIFLEEAIDDFVVSQRVSLKSSKNFRDAKSIPAVSVFSGEIGRFIREEFGFVFSQLGMMLVVLTEETDFKGNMVFGLLTRGNTHVLTVNLGGAAAIQNQRLTSLIDDTQLKLKDAGASLRIQILGKNLALQFSFPQLPQPEWLGTQVAVKSGAKVLIVDDEEIIRIAWRDIFRGFDGNVEIVGTAREFLQRDLSQYDHFFVDYDLKELDGKKGIDLINENKIQNRSVLVTSLFNQVNVQNQALSAGVKIIPKEYMSRVKRIIPILNANTRAYAHDGIFLTRKPEMLTELISQLFPGVSNPLFLSDPLELEEMQVDRSLVPLYLDAISISGDINDLARTLYNNGFLNIHMISDGRFDICMTSSIVAIHDISTGTRL